MAASTSTDPSLRYTSMLLICLATSHHDQTKEKKANPYKMNNLFLNVIVNCFCYFVSGNGRTMHYSKTRVL